MRRARSERSREACCMVSELLEQAGIDRERLRQTCRQVLHGIVLVCQWQLERLDGDGARTEAARPRGGGAPSRRGRRIEVR